MCSYGTIFGCLFLLSASQIPPDQLSIVRAHVSNERLVLQLISGLIDAYVVVGSQIRHSDSLPPFYKASSKIILEKTVKVKKAFNATDNDASPSPHALMHQLILL